MERRTEILKMTGRTEVVPLRRIMLVAAAAIFAAGCSTAQAPDQVVLATVEASLVGPRGYQGPAGPAGPQGSVGATGAPGYSMEGPAGAVGPSEKGKRFDAAIDGGARPEERVNKGALPDAADAFAGRQVFVEEVFGIVALERLPAGRQAEAVNLGRLES